MKARAAKPKVCGEDKLAEVLRTNGAARAAVSELLVRGCDVALVWLLLEHYENYFPETLEKDRNRYKRANKMFRSIQEKVSRLLIELERMRRTAEDDGFGGVISVFEDGLTKLLVPLSEDILPELRVSADLRGRSRKECFLAAAVVYVREKTMGPRYKEIVDILECIASFHDREQSFFEENIRNACDRYLSNPVCAEYARTTLKWFESDMPQLERDFSVRKRLLKGIHSAPSTGRE